MATTFRPYSDYEDSGVEWLGCLPSHWRPEALGRIASARLSSVDKLTIEGELSVRLCNYVDVYKNDFITAGMPFMLASATTDEVDRFTLDRGDVLITKDSESWNDIAVPALVTECMPDVLCGYHLAQLRPMKDRLTGGYLFRALQAEPVAAQFHVAATGVTRFGISKHAIKSGIVPLPPLPEQQAIARFLDRQDRRISRFVRAKQRLIALLAEQKQAIIHQAVTRGLDPDVPLKPSGIDWLGDVPTHWEVRKAKHLYREIDLRSISGEEELLSVSHISGVTPRSQKTVTMFQAETYAGHKLCEPNDLVVNTMWAWMGALGVSAFTGLVSPSYGVYRPMNHSPLSPAFANLLLRTRQYIDEYNRCSTGIHSSRLRLYPEQLLAINVLVPPPSEQSEILSHISNQTAMSDEALSRAQREIELIREYRTRLIADVVTGKLDVRNHPDAAEDAPDDFEEDVLLDDDDTEALDELSEVDEEVAYVNA